MTEESITTNQMSALAAALLKANGRIHRLTLDAIRGEITTRYAAQQINRIMSRLNRLAQ